MKRLLFTVLFFFGLMTLLASGILWLIRPADTNFQWITYVSPDTGMIHRQLPDGDTLHIRYPAGQYLRLRDWSPDGRWLLFTDGTDFENDLYRLRVNGQVVENLTPRTHFVNRAVYSPNGEWIVYEDDGALVRMPANGGSTQHLVRTEHCCMFPAWSPDSEWISYAAPDEYRRWSIYRIRADGSDLLRLHDLANTYMLGGRFPITAWSPDGEWIYFSDGRDRLEGGSILRARADGSVAEIAAEEGGMPSTAIFTAGAHDAYFISYEPDEYFLNHVNLDDVLPISQKISNDTGINSPVSVSADGEWVVNQVILGPGQTTPCPTSSYFLLKTNGTQIDCLDAGASYDNWDPVWSPLIDLSLRVEMLVAVGGVMMIIAVVASKSRDKSPLQSMR